MSSSLRQLLSVVADLVVPGLCAGCAAAPGPLCAACRAGLTVPSAPSWPTPCPPGLPPPYAAAAYEGPVRAALLAHKEHGRMSLARPLGVGLAMAVSAAAAAMEEPVVLVPIPSSRPSVRRRGYDPTGRIVLAAAGALRRRGIDATCLPVLRHQRRPADQSGLSAEQRVANLRGALYVPPRWRPLVADRRLILADDVLTTGATMIEATRALTVAGADVLACAVVAATRRKSSPRDLWGAVTQEAWANRIIPYPEGARRS